MTQNELGKKPTAVVITSIILAALIIIGTVAAIKLHNKPAKEDETTTATESTTEAIYTVDLAYIERMVKEERFTDKFENYSADSYPTSTTSSKEAYWKGIQEGKTVNPLLLAATSSYLSELGFDTSNVKPSELYERSDDGAILNARGRKTLESVKKVIFSEDVNVFTDDLGKTASKYYNSVPSKDDGSIEYAKKVGIKGNTVVWIITSQSVDIDAQFDDIVEKEQKGEEATTKKAAEKNETKQLVQLCRCGNTVDKTPKKPTPTTTKQQTTRQQTTRQQTTRQQTTRQQTTRQQTTRPNITITFPDITITTRQQTTRQQTTKQQTTKNPEKDPVNQGNANRGGGKNDPTEKATSTYQPEKPSKQTSVKTVEESTTVPATTKPATTKQATTKPAQTNPTTQPPTAQPTQKPSSVYKDDAGNTTVITPDQTFSGKPVLPD